MRSQALLPLLFAASAVSSPILEARTPPPTQQQVCDWVPKLKEYGEGHAEDMGELWRQSGASNYLHSFFDNNPVRGWTDKFFTQVIDNGKNEHGGLYNCMRVIGGAGCEGPGSTPCESYTPAAAYYIHQGLSNFRSIIESMHEAIQDSMITGILEDVEKISDMYGDPKPENENGFLILLGAIFGLGSLGSGLGSIGRNHPIASPALAGASAAFTLALGSGMKNEPQDFEKLNRETLSRFFENFNDLLQNMISAYFEGNFEKAGFEPNKFVNFITAPLKSGAMLSNSLVSKAGQEYSDYTRTRTKQALVINTLKANEFHVWQNPDLDSKDACDDEGDQYVWMNDRCNTIARILKVQGPAIGGSVISWDTTFLSEEQWGALGKDYGFRASEFFENALHCQGQEQKETDWNAATSSGLPACFVNLEVKATNLRLH